MPMPMTTLTRAVMLNQIRVWTASRAALATWRNWVMLTIMAMAGDKQIFLVAQIDPSEDDLTVAPKHTTTLRRHMSWS